MPLPALYATEGRFAGNVAERSRPEVDRQGMVLSGSCSAMTQAQVAAYALLAPHYALDPLALAQAGPQAALEWLSRQSLDVPPILYATAAPDAVKSAQRELGTARAGALVEDALDREESCGVHFREEYQTEEGEALRDDKNFSFVSAWEYKGEPRDAVLHKEELAFENVELKTRSYK